MSREGVGLGPGGARQGTAADAPMASALERPSINYVKESLAGHAVPCVGCRSASWHVASESTLAPPRSRSAATAYAPVPPRALSAERAPATAVICVSLRFFGTRRGRCSGLRNGYGAVGNRLPGRAASA
jgi:hypothetical protein